MKNQSFLDPLNDSEELIQASNYSLVHLADALFLVGNAKLGGDLMSIASDLIEAKRLLDNGRSMALNHAIKGSHQATVNMVNAALAVSSPDRQGEA